MSIINHTFGFVFVHVPKCAGTTVAMALSQASAYCDIEIGATPLGQAMADHYATRHGIGKHATAIQIRNVLGQAAWMRMFSFAFMRDPLARAQSTYRFLKHKFRNWRGAEVMDGFGSFEQFVVSDFFRSPGPDNILAPQLRWIGRPPAVDFIGRVETLEEDFALILETIGIPPSKREPMMRLGRRNRTDVLADSEAISPEVEAIVRDRYREDYVFLERLDTSRSYRSLPAARVRNDAI
ncbi:sulfotransferase family protein [Tepidamorphus gemmatus]|jgi:hypothetical protein|uniref:Sulfotransferase family protein n=1 Tax=Tepidamorphus gemmatus TaxID=747076 RepID=A0A4R3MIE7_9HYPH|nr:sulfotransferase family 2 domain-containing protein [Tepidamorphus gemmatus]TCT11475.1 sulfotransferase family protein [Tepidamorphus gemmatus]